MDALKKDLVTLGIAVEGLESLTVEEAKNAYHKEAIKVHPDKAGVEYTAIFQEVGNAYQRILKYIIDKLKTQNHATEKSTNDAEIFARENFDNFNFPFENKGSFTVIVEDVVAEVWQELLEKEYGSPRIVTNMHGTECDRIWKILYEHMDITLHFYNHNKPKDKKQSKILIQGAFQSTLCEFVFTELPTIYKSVCKRKVSLLTPLRQSKRKRITTTVKKRNIKYKPMAKSEVFTCALCELTSSSNVKLIRHMKTMHTQLSSDNLEVFKNQSIIEIEDIPKQLDEDMSVCELSDNDESNENLSKVDLKCEECTFNTSEGELLLKHKT